MNMQMATADKLHIYYARDFRFLLYIVNNITMNICNSATSFGRYRVRYHHTCYKHTDASWLSFELLGK